jgi:hypothetical protein
MKPILLAFAAALAIATAAPARAATEYVLIWTNYNPYTTEVAGGPFDSSAECYAVLNQESYVPGGAYSCRMIYVPGQ